jgi:hypothetical protein
MSRNRLYGILGNATGHIAFNVAILCTVGCMTARDVTKAQEPLTERLKGVEHSLQEQNNRLSELEEESKEAWSSALCSAEDREFFASVRAELTARNRPAECSTVALSCSAEQISPAIHGRGGLGALFKGLRTRAAFYLPKDINVLPEYRQDRLRKLGHLPLLPTTFFVFFAYPMSSEPKADADARERTETVSTFLLEHLRSGLKERLKKGGTVDDAALDRRVQDLLKDRIWNLRLDVLLKRKDLDRLDLPMPKIGEPDDLRRGVWVLRVDC